MKHMMLIRIAWRNIWRNKSRSLVVMIAITLGIWSIIFLVGMVYGMIENYIDNTIQNEVSHIKVQNPDFPKDSENIFFLPQADSLIQLTDLTAVKCASLRTYTTAMLSSGYGNRGIKTYGVDPEREKVLSGISKKMVEGNYLNGERKNEIIIGKRLADILKVKLKSKVVLTFQNLEGEISYGAFKIVGLFDTNNNGFDEGTIFVNRIMLNQLLGKEGIAHEIDLMVMDLNYLTETQNEIKKRMPGFLVRNYEEIQPELKLFESQIKMSGIIYMVIFMLALVFGIINTMMMAVLERVKELGMLMAVGMNKSRVFFMIILETLMLSMIAAPIGMFLGYLMTLYFEKNGIDLFFYSKEGMSQFGFDTFIYPNVPGELYWQLSVGITLTALIGSFYPAWKAISLSPVDAIRGQLTTQKSSVFKRIISFLHFKK